jgi:signal transduction histidine kinase
MEDRHYLMAIVQGSPVPTFLIDRDHRIVLWNHALEVYSGIRAGEIVGRAEAWRAFYETARPTLADLIVDRAIDQIPRWYGRTYAMSALVEGAYEVTDFFPQMRAGTWLFFTAAPVRDRAGAIIGAVETLQDVTEQKRAEEAQKRYAERLERSNEDLERFAYVASHDLQEPLRSIVSFSQLLERRYHGQLDADAGEYIAFIVAGGMRMQALIQDLLDFSRVESGATPPEPTDAAAVVAEVLRAMAPALAEAGATVRVGDLPVVRADPAQLSRVFANLIGNAAKYRWADVSPTIGITARRTDGMVEFAVQDNGIGIEEQYFDRIFEMLRRLHTHDEYEGTGIGLATVKRIVERLGGRVRVESTLGEGSTFFFTLPAA